MHAAALRKSQRLKRVLAVLRGGGEYSTREVIKLAEVCAVNSCIAELRQNGADISCTTRFENGEKRWFYTLIKEPENV